LEQFRPNQQSQDATHDEHGEAEQQIERSDVFVVGGIHPTPPAAGGVVVVVIVGVIVVV
jgi:hypothetical protein